MNADEQLIIELKKKHGELFLVEVEECKKSCILKKPGRKELSAATSAMAMAKGNVTKFNESIIATCFVHGDNPLDDIEDKDGYFMAVMSQLDQIIEIKKAEIKKL